jgi:hypothetical protein
MASNPPVAPTPRKRLPRWLAPPRWHPPQENGYPLHISLCSQLSVAGIHKVTIEYENDDRPEMFAYRNQDRPNLQCLSKGVAKIYQGPTSVAPQRQRIARVLDIPNNLVRAVIAAIFYRLSTLSVDLGHQLLPLCEAVGISLITGERNVLKRTSVIARTIGRYPISLRSSEFYDNTGSLIS